MCKPKAGKYGTNSIDVRMTSIKMLRHRINSSVRLSTFLRQLDEFFNAVQGLGSSLDLAQSTRGLRECLSWTTWLVGENARKLFPQTVPSNHSNLPHVDPDENSEQRRRPTWPPVPTSQSTVSSVNRVPVHKNLQALAGNIKNLRDVLEQFPEFENFGKRVLRCFEGDLEYWSSCLKKYGDGAESREVQFYIHYLSQELGNRLGSTGDCVKKYIACVPTVRLSQEHALTNLQTLATIATFFSAVTASTLQFSIANTNDTTTSQVVNTLWFCSLVFSIASALNSSIAFMWRSAVYSSPHKRLHGWLWLWMRQSPTMFLLISVLSFLAGLGCFAVSSQPNHIWIVVVICECVSSFSVAALLLWLAADKWSFYLLQQQQRRPGLRLNQLFGGKSASVLPTHVENTASWSLGYLSRGVQLVTSQFKPLVPRPLSRMPFRAPFSGTKDTGQPSVKDEDDLTMSPARKRWVNAINYAIHVSKDTRSEKLPKDGLNPEHMARLQEALQTISVAEATILHDAGPATSGIQFDPEGRYLALCGKRLTMRYDIGSSGNDPLRLPLWRI